jgi:tetratricopeptide (TPR) repeat protein
VTDDKIDAISITKDRQFYPRNDKVLIEIRMAGDGKDFQEMTFDLSGAVAKLDAPASGIFVGEPGKKKGPTDQDEDDCTRSLDPAKIIPACTKLVEDKSDTPHNRAVAYYDRGNAYKNTQDYDHALADYSEALALDPTYAHAYLNRGLVYAAKNDAARSIADSSRSIELDPAQKLAYLNRALAYRFQRNFVAAIADYNQAFKLGASAANDYQGRGLAYAGNGDFQRAVADFGEAIKRGANDAPTLNARAEAYRSLNQLEPALADYTAAIKLDANYAEAYHGRGMVYRLKGDFDRAIADYSAALARDSNLAAAYNDRGSAYRLKGDFEHATADYSAAIALYPKWAAPYHRRGYVAFLAADLPKALADLTQANALDPTDAYLALMLDIVAQRSKLPSRLKEMSGKLDMTAWPAPLIRLYLAQLTPEAAMAAAADPDVATGRGRICEANFYTGELALLNDHKDAAARLFGRASADCPLAVSEWELANAELKAMGINAPQGKR